MRWGMTRERDTDSTEGEVEPDGQNPGSGAQWSVDPIRTWATGRREPNPPTAAETADLATAAGTTGNSDVLTAIRVVLEEPGRDTRRTVLTDLSPEPGILDTSTGYDCGPDDDDAFDVLLASEHDSLVASSALATLDAVEGAAVASYRTDDLGIEPDDGGEAASDGAVAEAIEGDRANGDSAPSFEELDAELSPVDYDELVADLDEAGIGPDDDEAAIDRALREADADRSDDADAKERQDDRGPEGESPVAGDGGATTDESDDHPSRAAFVGDPPAGPGPPDPADDADGDDEELDPEAVLSALVTALDDRTLREEELSTVREALGLTSPESVRARVDHLSGRVDELMAYRDALESFIDETDGGKRVERIDQEVDALAEDLAATADLAEAVDERSERQSRALAEFAEGAADRQQRIDELAAGQQSLEADLRDRVEEFDRRLAELERSVEQLRTWRSRMQTAMGRPPDGPDS